MKKALKFLWTYKWFVLAFIALDVALVLQLAHQPVALHWVLGTVALIEVIPLLVGMFDDLRSGRYGIDILAATAIVTSVILGQYWAAIVLVAMITGGEALEAYAERRAQSELRALLERAPAKAHVLKARGKVVDVAVEAVKVGDKLIIKPGEIVPVDAEIIEGASSFDESSLTGESLPVSREVGGIIISGAINQEGSITARAIHSSKDSQYQQIVRLVRSAAASQAPFVRLADRYSIPFTVVSFAIAGGVWLWSGSALRFLEVIVVATPCPLLLAAPIALVSGMARASKFGIVVKSGSALERLAAVKTIAFDKTGTLTSGNLSVHKVEAFNGFKTDEVLGLAASLEQASSHVMARAVVAAANDKNIKLARGKHVTEIPGKGLRAHQKNQTILVGNLGLLAAHDVSLPPRFKPATITSSAVYVAVNDQLAGVILLTDTVRPESKVTLARLKALGIKNTLMVTGDSSASARLVAKELGIGKLFAETLPGEKLQIIESVEERPVAFVGDGVNDAPSLTAADVGIAIGARGSTAASESADLVIMPDDIGHVATALAIAKRTFRIARQSILVGIGLSVVMMLAFATGKFPPLLGAALQEVVDIVVIINALRAHSGKLA